MATFTRKSVPMRCERVREDGVVATWRGPKEAKRGDWLVYGSDDALADTRHPMLLSDVLFRSLYDPVDDEARALLEDSA